MTLLPRLGSRLVVCGLLASAPLVGACDHREPTPDPAVVLSWTRQGGVAGFCDELTVSASGELAASSCTAAGVRRRKLSGNELARLNGWRAAFADVSTTSRDPASADAMTVTLSLSGKGRNHPSETERQELLDWAQRVYGETGSTESR
jgi:hypothetical protein